jgi:DNA polymerase III delta subunit
MIIIATNLYNIALYKQNNMMAKKYLFSGEENYLLHKELQKRKDTFLTKHGPDTVMSISLGEYTGDEIIEILCSSGLFSDEKLIIVS